MSSSTRRNTALETNLLDSYRLAWNRLYFDDFQREAEFLTDTYSELLDISVEILTRYARNGRWQNETRIASIARQTQCSQNILVAALCLADAAAWLKRMGRGGEAEQIDRIAEDLHDISQEFKEVGQ